MKDGIVIVAIVAVVAILGLVFLQGGQLGGAFVTRPSVKIVQAMSYEEGFEACAGSKAECAVPDCPTGTVRVLMPGDIPRYQWIAVPTYMAGKQLGGCCSNGTNLLFAVEENFQQKTMQLSCSNGRWAANYA